ncbi:MAG: 50S ribosomal protein L3 [Deltaproteobacteria bacterium RIFCSPHIGHO2_12_FULL_43_9]|nr:MAG: 50S ribosomal protein L3 [Deltaproteobacteria bacterium RIFCSPHIGHO2_12_FULL_43_9]
MAIGLLGKKVGMTQIFKEDGRVIPVTCVQAGPCYILQKKSPDKDGYSAVQLGFDERPERVINKAESGHFKKSKSTPKRLLQEIRLSPEEVGQLGIGESLTVEIFKPGVTVDVTGVSKGKGFQGVMKRHGLKGFDASHGTHEFFRHGGAIGNRTTPGRTFKNKKMPGAMGNDIITIQNLKIEDIDSKHNLIMILGAIPGGPNGYVYIKEGVKVPKGKREVVVPSKSKAEKDKGEIQQNAEAT